MRRVRRGARFSLAIAILPIVGMMGSVALAMFGATTGGSGADTASYALTCSAAGIPISLPAVVTEGVLASDPVNPGSTDNLKTDSADVPDSAFGLYNSSTNPTGVNLLNGPDTGLGIVLQFPSNLEPLTTAGDTVTFSGTVPLTVANGSGSPSLAVNGGFTVPTTYPANAAVVITATQSGTITAGSSGNLSVAEPQFTSGSPLNLSIALGSTSIPITCTDTGVETIDSATNSGGSTGSTTTTTTGATTGTTTPTTASSTTTTTQPATGTSAQCAAKSTASTGSAPTLAADPGTCLSGGTVVSVTGSGFDPGSSGAILECNNSPGEPSVALGSPINKTVPVGCSGTALVNVVSTSSTGTLSTKYAIVTGTTGPPCGGSLVVSCPIADSADHNPGADAANYPCPPTAAQLAAGATCQLDFGDAGGKSQAVPISFVSAPTPSAVTTAAGAPTNSASTSSPTTAASTLAFTGPGPGIWMIAFGGILLIDLGYLLLTVYYRPRELVTVVGRRCRRVIGGPSS